MYYRLLFTLIKQKYPDTLEIHDKPFEGIENLHPETQKLLDMFYGESSHE